jgi:hypothetical protein
MVKKKFDGYFYNYKLYLVDIDTMDATKRLNCAYTKKISPGY